MKKKYKRSTWAEGCPNCSCHNCQRRNPWNTIPLSYGGSVSRFEPSRREKGNFAAAVANVAGFLEEAKDALLDIDPRIPSDFVLLVANNPDGEMISIVSGWRQLGRSEGAREQRRWSQTGASNAFVMSVLKDSTVPRAGRTVPYSLLGFHHDSEHIARTFVTNAGPEAASSALNLADYEDWDDWFSLYNS